MPLPGEILGILSFYRTLYFKALLNTRHMFRFSVFYFLLTIALLGLEIFIGACVHDRIIRPYGGDFLVVILLYCLVRSFWDLPILLTAVSVLIFSYLVEIAQYFRLADRLGFKRHSLACVLLGSYFSLTDIISYTLGILLVIGLETWIKKGRLRLYNH
jgi:hypothetical protein